MDYQIVPVTSFEQNCTLIWCNKTRDAALVDPGGDSELIKQLVLSQNVNIKMLLLTHGHIDHVGSSAELAKYYKVSILGPHKKDSFWINSLLMQSKMFGLEECISPIINHWMEEGDMIQIGNISLEVLHCPGHTPGHIVFFHRKNRLLISGDVLFRGGIGRTDLPYGNRNVLIETIKKKLFPLGDDITFIPGHGPTSTLGRERISNIFAK